MIAQQTPDGACVQAGKGSATLSMAYAAAKFGESCLLAMAGTPGVVECAYVDSHLTDLPFFASSLRLGPSGVEVGTQMNAKDMCACDTNVCMRTHAHMRSPMLNRRHAHAMYAHPCTC